MASPGNFVQITGTLGGDPELRYTTGGIAVCSFSVAWSPRKKTDTGWEDGPTSWFRCTVWREYGENVAASLAKGQRVVVTGQVHIREYEDNEGNKRFSTEIQVDEVGPSLRWATSTVEKVVRDKPVNENRGASSEPYYDDSEEPF
jgi:single-strand DNA-binding protein